MSGAATVTIEDVRHVADLASLELTPEELPHMAKDLNAVLGYIAQLNELNTSDVSAMAQASEAFVLLPSESLMNGVSSGSSRRSTTLRASESDHVSG